ncbi:DUF3800 domain-containing protein [Desulfobacula sp.]|uniref:DUF3800 domain-containing protein n=1 Tax=Desulfobacula sp. TaxID=2593537 RepID=UPI001EB8893C|nr:DUF3800 domain-containing protein [Desulfobacula sp.]
MNKYYFFLDETGDHGLAYVDPNFPLFLLCGCLFSENELSKAKGLINGFKRKYFRTEEVFCIQEILENVTVLFRSYLIWTLKNLFMKI